jgi:hypothetical protein
MSNDFDNVQQKYSNLSNEFKSLKNITDTFNPTLDQALRKVSILKNETNTTKNIINSLNRTMKKSLEHLGKAIGHGLLNDNKASESLANSGYSFTKDLPKLFANFLGGARASGGPVASNKAYLVGEKGPELFMPNTNGQIVANNHLGGRPINLVMNINSTDASSFRKSQSQILAEAQIMLQKASKNL